MLKTTCETNVNSEKLNSTIKPDILNKNFKLFLLEGNLHSILK